MGCVNWLYFQKRKAKEKERKTLAPNWCLKLWYMIGSIVDVPFNDSSSFWFFKILGLRLGSVDVYSLALDVADFQSRIIIWCSIEDGASGLI